MPFRGFEKGENFEFLQQQTERRRKKLELETQKISNELPRMIAIYKQAIDEDDAIFAEEQKQFIFKWCANLFIDLYTRGLLVYEGSGDNFLPGFLDYFGKILDLSFLDDQVLVYDVNHGLVQANEKYQMSDFYLELRFFMVIAFRKKYPFDEYLLAGSMNEYIKIPKN